MKVGFLGLLTLLFVGLKLGGVISWSWWWVVSPLLVTPLILLSVLITTVLFYKR